MPLLSGKRIIEVYGHCSQRDILPAQIDIDPAKPYFVDMDGCMLTIIDQDGFGEYIFHCKLKKPINTEENG